MKYDDVKDIREAKFENLPENVRSLLQDLSDSLKEITKGREGWCYQYYDQTTLGQAIYDDFVEYNESSKSFKFSDDFFESGILSQLEGFQFVTMLVESFGLSSKKYRNEISELLNDILDKIDNNGRLHLDATPYLKDSTQFDNSHYLDTMTWLMSMFCSVVRLIKQKDELNIDKETQERLFRLFNECLEYLTNSFIEGPDNDDKFSSGWNFTGDFDDGNSPSLYFTFAVSEVLIDIFKTFEATIKGFEIELVQNLIDEELENKEVSKEEIEAKKEQIAQTGLEVKEGRTAESLAFEKELFRKANGGKDAFENGSLYQELERQCKKAANNIWDIVKDKLTEEFFAPNVVSTVSSETIEQSITSDALFNNIFIINILMNAGLDEDLDDRINYYTVNGSEDYIKALADYDGMRDTMRLGYEHVYQMYSKLKKKHKEYKVNEYTLSFTENFSDKFLIRAQELRRAHIRVFSLMPLLVKTKTTMSDFVIKYPQFDMQIYLETILDSRYEDKDGNKKWLWEKDGYSSSSNYYFLSALSDFYDYYREYELKYSNNANKNNAEKKRIRDQYLEELNSEGGEIDQIKKELQTEKELNEKLVKEKEVLNSRIDDYEKEPLRDALTDFIIKAVEKQISDIIAKLFSGEAKNISESGKNRSMSRRNGEENVVQKSPFENSINELLISLMKEQMVDAVYKDEATTASNFERKINSLEKDVPNDFKKLLLLYLYQVQLMGVSDFAATNGYDGITDVLNAHKQQLAEKNKKN